MTRKRASAVTFEFRSIAVDLIKAAKGGRAAPNRRHRFTRLTW